MGELVQGTLDMLILRTLARRSMHGWGIAQHIQQVSQEILRVEEGSLYPALRRLELDGWVTAEWALSENNRRARFYSLTLLDSPHLLFRSTRRRNSARRPVCQRGP